MQCQISLVQRLDDTVVANGILGRDFGNYVAACGVRKIALYNSVRVAGRVPVKVFRAAATPEEADMAV